jgi:ketosteroid isomerase-like protein
MARKLVLISILLCACSLAAQPTSTNPERTATNSTAQVREAWVRDFNAKDADAVIALYAENATLVSEAGTFKGRQAIRTWVQTSIDQGSRLESIDPIEEKSSGTLAYGTGRSRRWVGTDLHLGQYLIVMERIGTDWKIVQHFSMNLKPADAR